MLLSGSPFKSRGSPVRSGICRTGGEFTAGLNSKTNSASHKEVAQDPKTNTFSGPALTAGHRPRKHCPLDTRLLGHGHREHWWDREWMDRPHFSSSAWGLLWCCQAFLIGPWMVDFAWELCWEVVGFVTMGLLHRSRKNWKKKAFASGGLPGISPHCCFPSWTTFLP